MERFANHLARAAACRLSKARVAWLAVFLVGAQGALASPTTVVGVDTTTCDKLIVPTLVDELGTSTLFPADELITSSVAGPTTVPPCPSTDLTLGEVIVVITNLTARAFSDLWYVADKETTITNVDGLVNSEKAFRIDATGINKPLIFESVAFDGIFAVGESWRFVLQDYSHLLGGSPAAFGSLGVPSGVTGDLSTGSIIAIEVPEPGVLLLVGGSLLAVGARFAILG